MGISRKLKLKKELEIGLAAGLGIGLSLLLTILTYIFGDQARHILTEERAELLESYLLIFSGIFISYVVFSLHATMRRDRGGKLLSVHKKLQENVFDVPLFFTIVFMVLREGFEIALFTASVSLFSAFMQNFIGLMAGFAGATVLGLSTFIAYIRFPISKVFKVTEYLIIILGAALTQKGITELLEIYFNVHLSRILPLNLGFLPDKESIVGHLLSGFFGIDQGLSGARIALMATYIVCIYLVFLRIRKQHKS